MFEIFKNLFGVIHPAERFRMWLVFALTVLMACTEAAGVASIMPFIAVLSAPEMIHSTRYLEYFYVLGKFGSETSFLIALGAGTFVILVSSIGLRVATQWMQTHFLSHQIKSISCRLVSGYLRQPYARFLSRNASQLGATVLSEVGNAVHGALTPAMTIMAHSLVTFALVVLLLAVDPMLSAVMTFLIGGAYVGVYLLVRRRLGRIGEHRRDANVQRYRVLHEAFGGIKDVKIAGLEEYFVEKFKQPSDTLARHTTSATIITELPSLVMQAIVFGGTLLMILYLMTVHGGIEGALPIIAVYGFAAYRLLPALQGIYRGFGLLRFNADVVRSLRHDLIEVAEANKNVAIRTDEPRLHMRHSLELAGITYRYPNSDRDALQNISVKISARTSVGIVGSTGSGKTTLVDVVLGLLSPTAGAMKVDGVPLAADRQLSWQKSIGYVPQSIHLLDSSIEENIAFGVQKSDIDKQALARAARAANLHEFVDELPEKYATAVGDNGVRLSGGQRQRIGIARALYRDPDVLIFDEATSALDTVTEQAVMDAINGLLGKKTVILIAHRLTTIQNCDEVLVLEKGALVARGTYQELLRGNTYFRALAKPAA